MLYFVGERGHKNMNKPPKVRGASIRESTFYVIFGRTGRRTRRFESVLLALILTSVAVVLLETTLDPGSEWWSHLRKLEIGFTVLFTVEYLVRLWCHPQPARYARSFFGIVDFVAIIPTYAALIWPGLETLAVLRALRIVRILRVLSMSRFSRAAELIGAAMAAARFKIGVFAVFVGLVVVLAGALMYIVEGPERGFTSIPHATYWAIGTLTTVGDTGLTPTTPFGKMFASVMMMMGYAFIAIPVGIITSEVVTVQKNLGELLDAEESERLEHKSSAFYSYENSQIPERVIFEASILKPVAGFLNGKGGTLIIGVDDNGQVIGVEKDLEVKAWDIDKYQNVITDRILRNLGSMAAAMTNITPRESKGKNVCVLDIQPAPDPVFLKTSKDLKTFYVRINNSTRELSGASMVSYLRKRWN